MAIEIYESDDTTLVSDLAFTNLDAGADSDALELHIWNDKGNPGGQERKNGRFVLQVEDRDTANLFVSTGWPPMDELWGRVRVIGYDNTGDSTWTPASTDWMPVGAYAIALLGDIPPDCALYVEILQHPPASAEELAWRWSATVVTDEYSTPMPPAFTELDRGILTGVGDPSRSGLVSGLEVTATGTPDDDVHVAAGLWLWQGAKYGKITTDHQLNQNDGAAAALASGESYYAALSIDATGVVVTKGTKAAAPTKPSPSSGRLLAYVTVDYQAGGTSVIGAGDIEDARAFDRYFVEIGTGRQLRIHSGRAIAGGTHRYADGEQLVDLDPSDTFYLWQLATGRFDVTTDETPPETTALGPLAEADTDASNVTALRLRPIFAGRVFHLVLRGTIPGTPGTIDQLTFPFERGFVDALVVAVSDNGGGASGATTFDVQKNGTSIFPSSGTEDNRPSIAFDATDLTDSDAIPETLELRKGDRILFENVAEPSGGTPASAELHLLVRPA